MPEVILNLLPVTEKEKGEFAAIAPQAEHIYTKGSAVTEEELARATVIFGWPKPERLAEAKSLRWFQTMWAGTDEYAGHIPAGAEFVGSALRELREELGVTAAPADLHECGLRRFRFEAEFHGKPFKDNQVSKVFCLWLDREAEDFSVQKSEIDYVKWFDLDEAVAAVEQGTIPNCIFPEELGMVKKFVEQTGGGC